MKYLLCVLVATMCVASSAKDIMNKEGYYFDNRIRTGHLNEYPYMDLFKNYVDVFIAPAYKGTRVHETDSYKNYAATAENCFNFFDGFRENAYELEKIEQLVELDACLGYLYDEKYVKIYHEIDKQRQIVAEKLDDYIDDDKFKEIYEGTKIHLLEKKAKTCIANLLLRTIQIKEQFKNLACNNHHIHLLNVFGGCHHEIPEELRTTDTYISTLFKLVKIKGRECYTSELIATNTAVRTAYKNNVWIGLPGWTYLGKQTQERMWPPKMAQLFIAVEGLSTSDGINVREIQAFARAVHDYKIREEDVNYVRNFLRNMETYANKHIKMKLTKKEAKRLASQDENGRLRYTDMVNGLCRWIRTSDSEGYYDYSTAFARLVGMLQYPELFDISLEDFRNTVVQGYEVAPVYTSISICNILTFTQGTIVTSNSGSEYEVVLKQDTSKMLRWPDAGYF